MSILPFSAVTPAAFGSSCLTTRKTQAPPGLSISIQHAIALATYGTFGLQGSVPVNSMLTAWMALTNPAKDIDSILTGFSWIPFATAISRLPAVGFCAARGYDPSARSKTWSSRRLDDSRPMPKCVFINEPLRSGMTTSHSDIPGRRQSFTKCMFVALPFIPIRRGPSGNLPRLDGKDSLSQNPGSHCCGTDARTRVQ